MILRKENNMKTEQILEDFRRLKTKEERDKFLSTLSQKEISDLRSLPIGLGSKMYISNFINKRNMSSKQK
jgi:hypothetical protein